MKKIIIIVCTTIITILFIGALVKSSHHDKKTIPITSTSDIQGQQQTITNSVEVTKATDITSTLTAWKTLGLTISDDQGAYFQTIGATKGGKYDVGQTNVELYMFSTNAEANNAKSSYFMSDFDTVIVTDKLLVDIHSTDPSVVNPIKAVF